MTNFNHCITISYNGHVKIKGGQLINFVLNPDILEQLTNQMISIHANAAKEIISEVRSYGEIAKNKFLQLLMLLIKYQNALISAGLDLTDQLQEGKLIIEFAEKEQVRLAGEPPVKTVEKFSF